MCLCHTNIRNNCNTDIEKTQLNNIYDKLSYTVDMAAITKIIADIFITNIDMNCIVVFYR